MELQVANNMLKAVALQHTILLGDFLKPRRAFATSARRGEDQCQALGSGQPPGGSRLVP